MKTLFSILGGVAVLALVVAMPVRAEMLSVSDSDLSGISGKANNTYLFSGTAGTTLDAVGGSANVQFGWYQWTDRHSNSDVDVVLGAVDGLGVDISDHKGANNQSGTDTTVQQNVVADANTINWGAYSALIWISGNENSTGSIAQMPYSTMGIGGF